MSGPTRIEWADKVWNPVVGCTPVSAGCANCYAKRIFERFSNGKPFSQVQLHLNRLEYPFRWMKPSRVFVNSMSDLFHEDVPDEFIDHVFTVMALSWKQTFMVLTKRPERMKAYLVDRYSNGGFSTSEIIKGRVSGKPGPYPMNSEFKWPLPNVWLGVTAENQRAADERIPLLLQTPAALRFVSVEPMLGPVDLWCATFDNPNGGKTGAVTSWGGGLDWVICGGESGPGARSMHPNWARDLRDQCLAAEVPFFFKSWGEWAPIDFDQDVSRSEISNGVRLGRIGKKAAGRLLEGQEWNQFPEVKS